MLAMIPTYTNSVPPPFLMIIRHTPGVGWKVKGGGEHFHQFLMILSSRCNVISHQSVKSFCCILVLK